jgi:hypothetical protein
MGRQRSDIGKVSDVSTTDLSKHPWTRTTKAGTSVVAKGWRARGRVKDRSGKFREVCVVRPTKGEAEREAKRRLEQLQVRITAGLSSDAPRTISDLAERWLAARAKSASSANTKTKPKGRKKVRSKRRLSANTLAAYASVVRGVIIENLGDQLVDELTVVYLDEVFESLDEVMNTKQARTVLRSRLAVSSRWPEATSMPNALLRRGALWEADVRTGTSRT